MDVFGGDVWSSGAVLIVVLAWMFKAATEKVHVLAGGRGGKMSSEEERVILTPELKSEDREEQERLWKGLKANEKKLSQRARVHGDRIRRVNGEDAKNNVANGQYVLYWMRLVRNARDITRRWRWRWRERTRIRSQSSWRLR